MILDTMKDSSKKELSFNEPKEYNDIRHGERLKEEKMNKYIYILRQKYH